MPARPPGDVEVDLDEPGAPAGGGRVGPGWARAGWAAAGLALGLLVGQSLPAGAPEPAAVRPDAPPVRMALGASAGVGLGSLAAVDGRVVLPVPAVVLNETSGPLVVRGVRVTGPGAALGVRDDWPSVTFPLRLPPGEDVEMPFTLVVDCSVRIRPVPQITLDIGPDDGSAARALDVRVPGLLSLWAQSRGATGCRD
jgi:hypothetical protein